GWAAECGDGGDKPLGTEALPGLLALPDVDDAKALIGRAGNVEDQPVGWRLDRWSRHPLVLLPGGRDILHEGVRHSSSSATNVFQRDRACRSPGLSAVHPVLLCGTWWWPHAGRVRFRFGLAVSSRCAAEQRESPSGGRLCSRAG